MRALSQAIVLFASATLAVMAALPVLWPVSVLAARSVPAQTAWQAPDRTPSVPRPPGQRLVLGYYVPYDPTSWASLQAQAQSIDVVAVQWVTIDACGQLTSDDDRTLKQFAQSQGIAVLPSLLTYSGWLNSRLLTDPETTTRALDQIVEYVVAEGYDGFDLDLEAVRADDRAAYTDFVKRLAQALHARGKRLALAVPPKMTDTTSGFAGAFDYAALGQHADLVTVMGYEWHGAWSGPGPIAPYDSVEKVVAFAASQMPPEKLVLALAFYGWDWNTTSGGSRYIGHPEAAALAERYNSPLSIAPDSRSATFRYRAPAGEQPPAVARPTALDHEIVSRRPPPCPITDPAPGPTPTPRPSPPPDAMQDHEVWLEEHESAVARLELAERYGVGGVAMWRLGHEEARVWSALGAWRLGTP